MSSLKIKLQFFGLHFPCCMSHLGSLLVPLCADSQQPPEQEVGDLQLSEDLWQRSDGAQHLTDHTIRPAQRRVDLSAHTCTQTHSLLC